jgi:hypothetical protein
LERFVNQNLLGKIDERKGNGARSKTAWHCQLYARANKPVAGRISTGKNLGVRIQ